MARSPVYISLEDAAEYTSLSTRTLRRRISDGALPAYKAGTTIRIRVADLEAMFKRIPNARTR